MKCEIVTEMRAASPILSGNPYNTVTMSCRTHGISIQGLMPIKDDLCPIGRIERLEQLCGRY